MFTSFSYCNFMTTNFTILEKKILHVIQFLMLSFHDNKFLKIFKQFWKRKYCLLTSFYRDNKFWKGTPSGKENIAR